MRFFTKFTNGVTRLVDFITTFNGIANQAIQTNASGFVDASLIPSGAGLPIGNTSGDVLTWNGATWQTTRPRFSWIWECYRNRVNNILNDMERNEESGTIEAPFVTPLPARIKFITSTRDNSNDYTFDIFVNGALVSSFTHSLADPDKRSYLNVDIDLNANDQVYILAQRIAEGSINEVVINLFVQEAYSTELLNR